MISPHVVLNNMIIKKSHLSRMAVSTTSLLPHLTQKEDRERFQENISPYQDQLVLLYLGLSLVP